jgi:hypothetical protein
MLVHEPSQAYLTGDQLQLPLHRLHSGLRHASPTLLLPPLLLLLLGVGPGSCAPKEPEPPAARDRKPPGLWLVWCTLMLQQRSDTRAFE